MKTISFISFNYHPIIWLLILTAPTKTIQLPLSTQKPDASLQAKRNLSDLLPRTILKPHELREADQMYLDNLTALLDTAAYGGDCDMNLHLEYVLPIYDHRKTEDETWQEKVRLNNFLEKNPSYAPLSCFGVVYNEDVGMYDENYMACVRCADPGNYFSFDCCKCVQSEPFVFEKRPAQVPICQLKPSVLGDHCDFARSEKERKSMHEPFLEAMRIATSRRDYVLAMAAYVRKWQDNFWTPPIARLACLTEANDMECTPENQCQCRRREPYQSFAISPDQSHCEGMEGSICHLLLVTSETSLEMTAECAHDLQCTPAIPGFFCKNFDNPDCLYSIKEELGEDVQDGDSNDQILLWNIRACGGRWMDKPTLRSGAFRNCNSEISSGIIFSCLSILYAYLGLRN